MNAKPEKCTEKEVLAVCQLLEMDVSVVESKAKFSEKKQMYVGNETESGFSDIVGNSGSTAVFIELKAPGKLKNLKPHQYAFLRRKLNAGCFAACVDSGDLLFTLYCQWKQQGVSALVSHLENLRPRT